MIIFESWDTCLFGEMKQRTKRFKEEELWNLADGCICALAKMKYYHLPHGNVNAKTIFKKGNNYKLLYV